MKLKQEGLLWQQNRIQGQDAEAMSGIEEGKTKRVSDSVLAGYRTGRGSEVGV